MGKTTRIMTINVPESEGYFPLTCYVYDVPFDIEPVHDDVYGVPFPKGDDYWSELNDFICEAKPVTKFEISEMLPEWVAPGKEYVLKHAKDGLALIDEEYVAIYVHSVLLALSGAVCVYSTIW